MIIFIVKSLSKTFKATWPFVLKLHMKCPRGKLIHICYMYNVCFVLLLGHFDWLPACHNNQEITDLYLRKCLKFILTSSSEKLLGP